MQILIRSWNELDNVKFDYLTFGSALQEDQKAKVTKWIKEKRESGKKVKAVLANTTANDEGIINYTTESVTISGEEYDADKFLLKDCRNPCRNTAYNELHVHSSGRCRKLYKIIQKRNG